MLTRVAVNSCSLTPLFWLRLVLQVACESATLLPVSAFGEALLANDAPRKFACHPLDNR